MMAKYNPFFERAGMLRVDYVRDGASVENRIREWLEARGFDFTFVQSKVHCRRFFDQLDSQDREVLLGFLTEFANQPFVKVRSVSPELLGSAFSSDSVYLYWVNSHSM